VYVWVRQDALKKKAKTEVAKEYLEAFLRARYVMDEIGEVTT